MNCILAITFVLDVLISHCTIVLDIFAAINFYNGKLKFVQVLFFIVTARCWNDSNE